MAIPLTPEQQAAADAVNARLAGVFGAGSTVAKNTGQFVANEQQNAAAITGQGSDAKYLYGGVPGQAASDALRYRTQAEQAQNRQGTAIDYGSANNDRDLGLASRTGQVSMAGLMAARARGETPSIAGMMADRQMGQAAAEQSSAAASARGPAALALAQQGAAANTAAMQSNISGQAQINAANERMQAEQGAMGAYGQIRGGDTALQGQDAGQAIAQGQLTDAQRQRNDAMTMGMTGFETGVNTAQLNANMGQATQQANGALNYQELQAKRKAAGDAADGQKMQAAATTAGTVAMMASDEQTKVPAQVAWGQSQPSVAPEMPTSAPADPYGLGAKAPVADFAWSGNNSTNAAIAEAKARDDAHRALDAQAAIEQGPGPGHGATGNSPFADSVEHGIGALKRRNEEDLGLIQSKERVGAKLTPKEKANRSVMERRMRVDNAQPEPTAAQAAAGPPAAPTKGRPGAGDYAGAALGGIGKAFARPTAPVTFQTHQLSAPMVQAPTMYSDDKTKLAAAFEAGQKAERVGPDGHTPEHHAWNEGRAAGLKAERVDEKGHTPEHYAWEEGRDAALAQTDAAKFAKREADAAWMKEHGVAAPAAPRSPVERPAAWGPAPAAPAPAPAPSYYDRAAAALHAAPEAMSDALGRVYDYASPSEGVQPSPEPAPSRWNPMMGRMRAMVSDGRTKNVGTLGKQIDHSDMADFARSMRGVPYAYKPEFAAREGQAPGEVNVGPVAQEMEKSKVGRTIVKPDPQGSGMRTLDEPKMVKGLGAVVADQQEQLDEMRSLMARRFGGGR